jgi:Holliday junction resolvase
MANPSKQKGTAAETRVVKYLERRGIHAQRKALHGKDDHGDLDVYVDIEGMKQVIFEVKTGKQTANPNRTQIEEWIRQTNVEAENAGTRGFLCVARYRRKLDDADIWWKPTGSKVLYHMYLDEFCQIYK